MSSTPVTPIVVTPKPSAIGSATTIIMILAVLSIMTAGGVYLIDFLVARHDVATATKYETILTTQVTQTKSLQQQLAATEAEDTKRDEAYQKTIAQLSQNIIQRNANAQKQQTVDANLDAAAAAQRLLLQTKAGSSEVTVAGPNVVLDLPVARTVVSDLDTIPVLQSDLADTQSQLISQKNLTNDAQQEASAAKNVIGAQTVQLVDAQKVCSSQIAVLKARDRKSKLKWFGIGYVAGFISGILVRVQ